MYQHMYFDFKRSHDPDKIWVPGRPIEGVIVELMRKQNLNSYIEIHNENNVDIILKNAGIAKFNIIHINPSDIQVEELINILNKSINLISDCGYILVDRMFPYYEEFNSDLYKAFVSCQQTNPNYQYKMLWDCSYGVGVITKGEDQNCIFNTDDARNIQYGEYQSLFNLFMRPVDTDLFFDTLENPHPKYKYAVLTAIFNGYEMVREIDQPREDVEYVLVTDDPTITSKTWKVKLIDSFFEDMSGYAKAFYVKYHPFEFVESDTFIWVDGSVQIKKDFTDEIMMPFINSNYEILELVNTITNIGDYELNRWCENKFHGFDDTQCELAKKLFHNEPWVDEMQVQTTIYGCKNTRLANLINNRTWDIMRRDSGSNYDITILYMPQRGKVLSKYAWNTHKVYYYDACTLFCKYFDYCYHNSMNSQKESWHSIGNYLENYIWGGANSMIYPKKINDK